MSEEITRALLRKDDTGTKDLDKVVIRPYPKVIYSRYTSLRVRE